MPRLELGTKFWIADVVQGGVQIRWGELGTAGKSVRLLVRETGPMVASVVLPTESYPELVAQCRAAPDDPTPWAVYADWLIAQGDLRGELAARIGGRDPTSVESLRARWLPLRRLTALTSLSMIGPPPSHPALRALRLFVAAPSNLDALVRAALPALERLELFLPSLEDHAGGHAFVAVLDRVDLPALRQLRVDPDERVIRALAGSRLLPQLTSLDLSREPLAPGAASLLADNAAAFRHLDRIDVGPHRGGRISRELPNVRIVAAP